MIVLIMKMMLAERLKHIRELNKVSMRKLAEAVDLSVSNISFYESGKSVPSAEIIFKLAQYFNVSSDYLLGLVDEPQGDIPAELKEKIGRLDALEAENEALREKIKTVVNTLLENDEGIENKNP